MVRMVRGAVSIALGVWCLASAGSAAREEQAVATATKHESYTESVPGTKIQFEMVAIPGGTFVMGSPAGEAGRADDEGPAHPVRIAPLWVARTETTWDQYRSVRIRAVAPSPGDRCSDFGASRGGCDDQADPAVWR